MFGYIKTHRPELKVAEDEAYKGVYCTLCRELGRRYTPIARLLLSYDTTFLAVALMALSDRQVCFERKRCPFNPAKKCHFCSESREETQYAADVTVLLAYHKLRDNINDSTLIKAFLNKILLILLLPMYKKAVRLRPEAAEIISSCIQMQSDAEKRQTRLIDEAAQPTALMLAKLFSEYGFVSDEEKNARYLLGYRLGRWVYMIDAFDDIEKDRRTGNYNPYLFGSDNFEKIKGDILMTAGEAAGALDALELKGLGGIVRNVIFDGLYFQTQSVYERRLRGE